MRYRSTIMMLFLAVLGTGAIRAEDLRDQYGTRSLEVAKALDEGIRLVEEQKPQEGLQKLKQANEIDPDCQMVYHWLATAYIDMGDIDHAMSVYQRLYETACRTRITNISVDGCVNAGLTMGKLDRERESWPWFSRAILFDPEDHFHLCWKAYRNMAIGLSREGRHLSAAACALEALQTNPPKKAEQEAMAAEMLQNVQGEEAAQLLYPIEEPAPAPLRSAAAVLEKVAEGPQIDGEVARLLTDADRGVVYAFLAGSSRYVLVDYAGGGHKTSSVTASGPIHAATLAAGRLYLALGEPSRIVLVDGPTGKEEKAWRFSEDPPSSLAVLQGARLAAFPIGGVLHALDMEAGNLEKTHYLCTEVETDPRQQSFFAWLRPASPDAKGGHILIGGKPAFFDDVEAGRRKGVLFRFVPADRRLVLASLRLQAASDARGLHVSPDGRWAVLVLGEAGKRGCGVAAFPACGLGTVKAFFESEAPPIAAALNPVTGQVAVLREQGGQVCSLANPEEGTPIEGAFRPACAWSGDGRFLYVAGRTGLLVFRNVLSKEEEARASSWREELVQARSCQSPSPASPSADDPQPAPELADFRISNQRADVVLAIRRAEREGRTTKPVDWGRYPPYWKDPETARCLESVNQRLDEKDYGLLVYQLRERQKAVPGHPGLGFLLGYCLYRSGQYEAAEPILLSALKADQGRTSLATECLRCLAHLKAGQNDALAGAYCYAEVLFLDQADPLFLKEAAASFAAAKLEDEAKGLLQKAVPGDVPAKPGLPALPKPFQDQALNGQELYRRAAPSVVLVRTPKASGSGVCVGKGGWIITNAHVVSGGRSSVEVIPYEWRSDKLTALPALQAEVAYLSEEQDIAMLRLDHPPATLLPMMVADREPRAGERVYALGSPGLGKTILDQSLSEGIISGPARKIGDQVYLQHTAAINPGNSGGPLLDEFGRVLGLVTLKFEMEKVGFAIPALRLRAVLEAGSK